MKYRRDCHDFLTQSGGIIFLLRDYMIIWLCVLARIIFYKYLKREVSNYECAPCLSVSQRNLRGPRGAILIEWNLSSLSSVLVSQCQSIDWTKTWNWQLSKLWDMWFIRVQLSPSRSKTYNYPGWFFIQCKEIGNIFASVVSSLCSIFYLISGCYQTACYAGYELQIAIIIRYKEYKEGCNDI